MSWAGGADEHNLDGSYETRNLWPGDYTVQFGGSLHVSEWWDNAVAAEAKTITVKPGQMVTGISAALAKGVKAVERPTILGDAWVGRTLRLDKGEWTQMADNQFTYEWLVKATVIVFEKVGVKKNGEAKLKLLGKGTVKAGKGVVRFKKALAKGKHKLVFTVKGKGKIGSGDIKKSVKIKR